MVVYPHRRDTSGTRKQEHGAKCKVGKARNADFAAEVADPEKAHFITVAPGVGLGYRRNRTAGSWVVRAADGRGGNWTQAFAHADDFEDANGDALSFWEAQDRARVLARGHDADEDSGKPVTVAQVINRYELDLKARGGDSYNAQRVRRHLPDVLASKTVALLATSREFRHWRDGLLKKGLTPSTVNRTCAAFQAALELAAAQDPRITNQSAWRTGLATLPDAEQSRNIIIPEDAVLSIISAAYTVSPAFGLLVEVAAVTGARVSQLARLEVGDLQADRSDPRLMMPSARKGRGRKRIERRPVPIPTNLAMALKQAGAGRPADAPLLIRPSGEPWRPFDHRHPFERAVKAAGLNPVEVTIYALRHSSIVRQLLANTPIRVVATLHDTSVVMIERTYSKFITDHSDALSRRALLDTTRPIGENVVVLKVPDNSDPATRAFSQSPTPDAKIVELGERT
jgi:integrase